MNKHEAKRNRRQELFDFYAPLREEAEEEARQMEENIGNMLKQATQNFLQTAYERGYKRPDIAAMLGTHRSLVRFWEYGTNAPNLRNVRMMEKIYYQWAKEDGYVDAAGNGKPKQPTIDDIINNTLGK